MNPMRSFSTTTSDKSTHTKHNYIAASTGIELWGFVLYLTFVFFNPQNFFSFIRPFRLALVIAFFSFVVALLRKRVAIFRAVQTKLFVILLLIVAASTINSLAPGRSFDFLQMYVRAICLYLLFILVIQSEMNLHKIVWVMMCFLFINSVITLILQKMGFMPYRLLSFYGEGPNDFALMLLAMLPFPISLMQKEKSRCKRGFLILTTLGYLLCLTRTRSRMGFYGLLVLLAQIAWSKRRNPAFILIIGGLVTFTFLNTHYGYWDRVRKVSLEEAKRSRIVKWGQAVELMKLRPILGVGPGNFVPAVKWFSLQGEKEHVAHNAFLEVGAENGIFALFIYLILMLVSVRDMLSAEKYLKKRRDDLYAVAQAARMGFITLSFSMLFLSQEYNHFYYIFAAMSVVLRNLATKHLIR